MDAGSYKVGVVITWQGPSSASQSQTVPLDFVTNDGVKLSGTFFIVESTSGKEIHEFSTFPGEMEVLFRTNSHFKVVAKLIEETDKHARLHKLSSYDLTNLEVYVLRQM